MVGLTRLVCVFLKPEPLTQGFEDAQKLLEPASFVLGGVPSGLDPERKSILLKFALLSEIAGERIREYHRNPRKRLAMEAMGIVMEASDELPEPYRAAIKTTVIAMVFEDLSEKEIDRTYDLWVDDLPQLVPKLIPSDQMLDGMSRAVAFSLIPSACKLAMRMWMRNPRESSWLSRAHQLAQRMAQMEPESIDQQRASLGLLVNCYRHQGYYENEQGAWKEGLCHLHMACEFERQALTLLENQTHHEPGPIDPFLLRDLIDGQLYLANNIVRKVIIQVSHDCTTTPSDAVEDMYAAIRLANAAINSGGNLTVNQVMLLGTLSSWLVVLCQTTEIETIILAAVRAFPNFTFSTLNQEDHGRQMRNLYMVGDVACALTLEGRKDTFTALSRLETCRAVFLNSRLEAQHRREASSQTPREPGEQLESQEELGTSPRSNYIQQPSAQNQLSAAPDYHQDNRTSLAAERLVHQGFSDTESSPFKEEDLSRIRDFTVVVINTTWAPLGSHALIIKGGKIDKKPIPLPDAPQARIEERVRSFRKSLTEESQLRREQAIQPILRWLWQAIVHPILTCSQLGISGPPQPGQEPPQIWWVPSALLSQVPLHGAGDCQLGSQNSALDWVVSSYVPSVQVLLQLHQSSQDSPEVESALLVSVSSTKEHSDLLHAESEVLAVQNTLRETLNPSDVHVMHNPTKENVVGLIKHSQVFHFAGHGYAHPTNPSQSYLLLPNRERLSGEDLMTDEMAAARPWLAYLSACSTSRTHEERLMNESSHLNGVFLLAGFRHIVGTLWEVSDSQSQKLASLFYSKLKCSMKNGKRDGVALALNTATRELRNTLMGRLHDAGMGAGREQAGDRDGFERMRDKPVPADENSQYLEDAVKYMEDWRDLGAKRKNREDDESIPDKAYFTWAAYVHMGL